MRWLFPAMWLIWLAYWIVAARGGKANARRQDRASRLASVLPMLLAMGLLAAPSEALPGLNARFLPLAYWPFWTAPSSPRSASPSPSGRARIWRHNWSGTVTVKQGHELIQSGPYAFVRHPIYTGLLTALIGTAMAVGEWRAVIAVLIVLWALGRKLALEERWMREVFGAAYDQYCARVPALVPFAKGI